MVQYGVKQPKPMNSNAAASLAARYASLSRVPGALALRGSQDQHVPERISEGSFTVRHDGMWEAGCCLSADSALGGH